MARFPLIRKSAEYLRLAETRPQLSSGANLLTQAGYTLDLVVTVDRAMRRAIVERYHLAIISTSFIHNERLAIRAHLKQVKPGLPVLLLGRNMTPPGPFWDPSPSVLVARKRPTSRLI